MKVFLINFSNIKPLVHGNFLNVLVTHLLPIHPFFTPWRDQQTLQISGVFRRYRKDALGTNGLMSTGTFTFVPFSLGDRPLVIIPIFLNNNHWQINCFSKIINPNLSFEISARNKLLATDCHGILFFLKLFRQVKQM